MKLTPVLPNVRLLDVLLVILLVVFIFMGIGMLGSMVVSDVGFVLPALLLAFVVLAVANIVLFLSLIRGR